MIALMTGAAPFQTTLAVDAFEIADQQHAEVATRRQRWAAVPRRVLRRTLHLHEPVEVGRDQHRLQLVVESVTRRAWQLRPRYQYVRLPFALPPQSHSPLAFLVRRTANQTQADFVNGLSSRARYRDHYLSFSLRSWSGEICNCFLRLSMQLYSLNNDAGRSP